MSRAFKHKAFMIGALILAAFLIMAVFSGGLAPYDPISQALRQRFSPPSLAHWMGTDALGRDIWSRVIWGARISLLIGFLAVLFGGAIGTAVGLVSGFFGGWVDAIVMRLIDAMLALPTILIALVIVAIVGPGGIFGVVFAVGVANAPRFARLIRADVLSIRTTEYVTAARALGASRVRLMMRHILPNAMAGILVLATLRIGEAVLAEASLSFLGFGPQPPNVTWGSMIADGRNYLRTAPWTPLFPASAIMLLVIGFNLAGDGLVDLIDPKRGMSRGGAKS